MPAKQKNNNVEDKYGVTARQLPPHADLHHVRVPGQLEIFFIKNLLINILILTWDKKDATCIMYVSLGS